MSLNPDATFPSRRVYVVKVHRDAVPGALRGRVENLLTCEPVEFTTGLELMELIETDLIASEPRERG